jgi:hypothetical protein
MTGPGRPTVARRPRTMAAPVEKKRSNTDLIWGYGTGETRHPGILDRLGILERAVRAHKKILYATLASVWLDIIIGHATVSGSMLTNFFQALSGLASAAQLPR